MRLRILVSAYYCSPYQGGESAVGWQVASNLARHHDVTVICGDLSEGSPTLADTERARAEGLLPPGMTVRHLQADGPARVLHDLHALPGLWFLYYRAYRRWQVQVLEEARRLHEEEPFDLVHHVTIIGYREPGYLWKLGIPFFWGPINGAAGMPWGFIPGFGLAGIYRHVTRNVMNAIQMRFSGRCRKAAQAASKIWTVTPEDHAMVHSVWGYPAETMIETAATPDPQARVRELQPGAPLKLVWCGLVEARKALHLALHAIAGVERVELHVIGDGPERPRCQELSDRLGCTTIWHGRVDHAVVRSLMSEGHVLIHTSLKEGTPHVVLEAMASGMPVICHDSCGMATAVDNSSGLKVSLHGPDTSIAGFREAVIAFRDQAGLLAELSAGAIQRSQELTWPVLTGRINQAYLQVLATREAP